jgi:2-phospho-L-lactate transferase/gluconeogenesis factor (CofD/UPF0052 family)
VQKLNGKGYDLKARMALPGLATALRQATNYKQKKVMETLHKIPERGKSTTVISIKAHSKTWEKAKMYLKGDISGN